jgi:demethylmenaquinone methyltransferase/2-methoxy-6-polyprenyl-1,4-benzoquinol methylase
MKDILPISRSKDRAQSYYDRLSGMYDWLTQSEVSILRQGVSMLSPASGERILDIGAGTGKALEILSDQPGENRWQVALDLSRRMLIRSREKLSADTTAFLQADGARLPLGDASFDAVYCAFTLELFQAEEIPEVLAEMRRVLRPAGRLAIVAMAQRPRSLAVRLYEAAHRLFPVAIDCRPIPLLDFLQDSGFKVVQHEKRTSWGLPMHLALAFNPGQPHPG